MGAGNRDVRRGAHTLEEPSGLALARDVIEVMDLLWCVERVACGPPTAAMGLRLVVPRFA